MAPPKFIYLLFIPQEKTRNRDDDKRDEQLAGARIFRVASTTISQKRKLYKQTTKCEHNFTRIIFRPISDLSKNICKYFKEKELQIF